VGWEQNVPGTWTLALSTLVEAVVIEPRVRFGMGLDA